jgi:hypothetical protein
MKAKMASPKKTVYKTNKISGRSSWQKAYAYKG